MIQFLIIFLLGLPSFASADTSTPKIGISEEAAHQQSVGCQDCHSKTDAPTMHKSKALVLGCSDCHGGNPSVRALNLAEDSKEYLAAKKKCTCCTFA